MTTIVEVRGRRGAAECLVDGPVCVSPSGEEERDD